MECQYCHAGKADFTFNTMDEAHEGLIHDPSVPGESACTECHGEPQFAVSACNACHQEEVEATANSLHTNLWGEKKAIEDRCGCTYEGSDWADGFKAKCAGCHTTCGQCHVSRPNSVGGGFPIITLKPGSHRFRGTPDMNEQCTACHGSRVGTDYKGEIEGNVRDVHYSKGYRCEFCHKKNEIHGDGLYEGEHYDHRYEVATMPRCEHCHGNLEANDYHNVHVGQGTGRNLQCQVCHSQPYKNCTNCHNLVADDKVDKFDIDPSVVQLKIAQNPSPYREEYDFVLVRHTPIDPDTYADWGLALPDYNSKPTWQYTSPHNVIRRAPQTGDGTGSCSAACHGSADGPEGYLLRDSDLRDDTGNPLVDYDANKDIVIRPDFPGKK
jgi:thiosulfate/3-mercaptopyruvate sulfurtransferase